MSAMAWFDLTLEAALRLEQMSRALPTTMQSTGRRTDHSGRSSAAVM